MQVAERVDIMMGFFSSSSFAEIAPGLAAFLNNSDESLRLIISPYVSEEDQQALRGSSCNSMSIATSSIEKLIPDTKSLETHTLECLAWLISNGRLCVKVVLMPNALFHSKVWLFYESDFVATLHGSANMTKTGIKGNREQLSLDRNWRSSESNERCKILKYEFKKLWLGNDPECVTVELPQAIERKILQDFKGERQPTEDDYMRLWHRYHGFDKRPLDVEELLEREKSKHFKLPEWLVYQSGEYAHQEKAINAWFCADKRGILEMCTGSGKTLTALTAAQLLYEESRPLLIVITAPYNVLVSQWCEEIKQFCIEPINLTTLKGHDERKQALTDVKRRLSRGVVDCEVVVVSNKTFCDKNFQFLIKEVPGKKLLIADECHNLGMAGFIQDPPHFFEYRLGLSATPVRQYDDEGTDKLFSYFGETCFRFSLSDAIGKCLTPYKYYVDLVDLNNEEMLEWYRLTGLIRKQSWKFTSNEIDDQLKTLLLKRRKILETAEFKISTLENLISGSNLKNLQYTLIYTTDKDSNQIDGVNSLLRSKGISYHQITANETSNPKLTNSILERFQAGELQVLTAKRVLDEGVNVPQIMQAYILASTTVKRQWVQRRGRLLRKCNEIGKDYAVIHDLVVLPRIEGSRIKIDDDDAKKIVDDELDRVWEFSKLSENAAEPGGPYEIVEKMRKLIGK